MQVLDFHTQTQLMKVEIGDREGSALAKRRTTKTVGVRYSTAEAREIKKDNLLTCTVCF